LTETLEERQGNIEEYFPDMADKMGDEITALENANEYVTDAIQTLEEVAEV